MFFTEEKIIKVAKEIIASLKNNLEYKDVYYQFISNQISEKEFDVIAEKYVIEQSNKITKELIDKIKIYLLYFNNEDFVPSDISNIFGITIEIAEKILEDLYNPNFTKKLFFENGENK